MVRTITRGQAEAFEGCAMVIRPRTPVRWTEPASRWTAPAFSWTEPASRWTEPASSWTEPASNWTEPASSWTEPASSWTDPRPVGQARVQLDRPASSWTGPVPNRGVTPSRACFAHPLEPGLHLRFRTDVLWLVELTFLERLG